MKNKYYNPQAEMIRLTSDKLLVSSPDDGLGNEGEDIPGITLPEDTFPLD